MYHSRMSPQIQVCQKSALLPRKSTINVIGIITSVTEIRTCPSMGLIQTQIEILSHKYNSHNQTYFTSLLKYCYTILIS